MKHTHQVLLYSHREEDIRALGAAITHLGHKDIPAAIEILQALRDRLMEEQMPRLEIYNPRNEAHR